jgi:repressor of nif and glnA expression
VSLSLSGFSLGCTSLLFKLCEVFLDPFEIFIAGRMTDVAEAVRRGEGKVLASFHESPMPSRAAAESVLQKLRSINLCQLVVMSKMNELICEVPVMPNKIALVLPSGLNAVAAVAEKGINVTCKAMSGVIDVQKLRSFDLL